MGGQLSKVPESVKLARRARTREARTRPEPSAPLRKVDPVTVARTCKNFGAEVGSESCPTCKGGRVTLRVYSCQVYGTCTVGRKVGSHGCCTAACEGYAAKD
jgi:hypothetical protein